MGAQATETLAALCDELSADPAAANRTLAALCDELSADPAAANRDLDPQLRGWSFYLQEDGTRHVAFECAHSGEFASEALGTAVIAVASEGGIELTLPLAERASEAAVCREAAHCAAEAARPAVAELSRDEGSALQLRMRLAEPVTAQALAQALCALELAALACAREVRALAADEQLARAYLVLRAAWPRRREANAA